MANFNLDGFTNESVIDSGLIQPIALGFLPDNRMLVLEKNGVISIADPNSGDKSPYLDISNIVNSDQERGLLEIAIPPDFDPSKAGKNQIYLYYTRIPVNETEEAYAVIGSFTHRERSGGLSSRADRGSENILWTDTDGYVSCCHYGGGLDFGPDGKLWLTSSDKFNTSNAGEGLPNDEWPVDLEHTSGKIIRINRDGSIPDGKDGWPANPYVDGVIDGRYPNVTPDGQPFQPDPSIWAYGLRNPFRADWDEEYGKFYIGEVGGNQRASADDLHVASLDQAGAFYGWNFYEGKNNTAVFDPNKPNFPNPNAFPRADRDLANSKQGDYYSAPIFDVSRLVDDPNGGKRIRATALVGGFVYRGTMFPDEFDGVYFYANYRRNHIKFLDLNDTGDVVEGVYDFKPSGGGIPGSAPNVVFLEQGVDGALYYVNYEKNGGQVQRITYPSSNSAPFITSPRITDDQGNPDDLTGTSVPLNITYRATVGDADTALGDLTYRINFGDGTVVNGKPDAVTGAIAVNHQYKNEGVYDAVLNVSDGSNTTGGRSFEITVGSSPQPPEFQSADTDIAFIESGDSVLFTAVVADADDPAESLTYTLNFGDGSRQVVGNPNAKGEIRVRHTYTDDGAYSAFFTVSDGKANPVRSDTLPVLVGASSQLPVTRGLVLQVEAFTKTTLDGSTVATWLDQSGSTNDLAAAGDPQLVENATPTGKEAVVLDGKGDYLFYDNSDGSSLTGFSEGNDPRTMFFVVDYEDVTNKEFAGLVYGRASNNQAFGLTLNGNEDDLTVHGWGRRGDKRTNVDAVIDNSGKQRGFISHAVVFDGSRYQHYLNGVEIDSGNQTYNTVAEKLLIGQNLNGGETPMSVAAALIYNRALNSSELGAVENYIQQTYLGEPTTSNNSPVAANDPDGGLASQFTTNENTSFTTGNVLSNDSDADGDSLSVSSVNTSSTLGLVNSNGDGTFTYNPNGQFDALDEGETATDSFVYTVSDGEGGTDTATVTVKINGVGDVVVNQPPNARNDSYSAISGRTLSVPFATGLLDNDTDDGAISVVEINGQSFSSGSPFFLANGSLTINSNGSFSYTPNAGFKAVERFTYTVSDGAQTDTASVNIAVSSPPSPTPTPTPTPPSGGGNLPVSDKLVAQFESDSNVFEENGFVTGWRSGTGSDMDLVAVGDPRLVRGATPTGQAAISLDGGRAVYGETGAAEGDSLQRTTPGRGLASLPSGDDPRTMYFVVDYQAPNAVYAGASYGRGRGNNAFGLTLSGNSHRLTVNGVGRKNTFTARPERGVGNNDGSAGDDWFIQSVRYDGSTLRQYRDNRLIDTNTHKYNTIVEHFLLGKNPKGRGFSSLDVAAVLVYDKELSDREHEQTIDYLTQKYIAASAKAQSSASKSSVQAFSAPTSAEPSAESAVVERITDDLVALYTFDESTGKSVKDTSGKGKAFDLSFDDLTGASWGDGTLTLDQPTLVSSAAPVKLADALTGDAVTLEAWITSDSSNQSEAGPVVSLSTSKGNKSLSLSAPSGLSTDERTHLVYTAKADGSAALYVDGKLAGVDTVEENFSTLDRKYELTLGGSNSAWLGTLDLVAVYSQSFDANEVEQNFLAGPGGANSGLL